MSGQPDWRNAYLGLGSNLGNRLENLRYAVHALGSHPHVQLRKVSAVYETEPVGDVSQPYYLNAVVAVRTRLAPEALLDLCLRLEAERGRVRKEHWGPRTLDVDVLLVEGVHLRTTRLELPHPELTRRRFVLQPLSDVAHDELLEPFGKTGAALLAGCSDTRSVRFFGPAELLSPSEVQHARSL